MLTVFLFKSFFGIIGAAEAVDKSAASAASPDAANFEAVIKSAASAASRKPKSREGSSRGVPRGPRPPGEPLSDSPGAASSRFGLPGGCASSRLDHGLKLYGIRGGCASSRLIHGPLFAIFGRASGQVHSKNTKETIQVKITCSRLEIPILGCASVKKNQTSQTLCCETWCLAKCTSRSA